MPARSPHPDTARSTRTTRTAALAAALVSAVACAVCFSGLWPAVQVGADLPPWARLGLLALVLPGPLGLALLAKAPARQAAPVLAARQTPHDNTALTVGNTNAGPQETILQLRELLVLAEGERWHFGQAIHDELGQRLSGMAYFAKALQRKLQKEQRAEAADAGWLTDLANESMTVARGLARGLLPVGTDDPGGLGAALAESCDRAAKTFGIECSLQVDPDFDAGGAAQASHLYHAVQELVTNAVKHGRARQVQVSLQVLDGGQRATVRNDGERLAAVPPLPGMGLRGVRSRAAYLGARFTLANEPQGTVLASIELPPAPALTEGPA